MTGADRLDAQSAGDRLRGLRAQTQVPVVVGFGIRDAASAVVMAVDADGVVVGSALVTALSDARMWTPPVGVLMRFGTVASGVGCGEVGGWFQSGCG